MRSALAALATLLVASMSSAGDGVLEINQTCAVQTGCFEGDAPGFPVTIVSSGSYKLTGSLFWAGPTTFPAIQIDGDDVSLDLNGFIIEGVAPGGGTGAGIGGSGNSISISHGTVKNFWAGISMTGNLIDLGRLTVFGYDTGVSLSFGLCRISGSRISMTRSGRALRSEGSCHLEGNQIVAAQNGVAAVIGGQSTVLNNTISGADGGLAAPGSIIRNNVINAYLGGAAISAGSGSLISGNKVLNAGGFAIVAEKSVVENNLISAENGISCADCSVVGNVTTGGVLGLDASGGNGSTGYQGNQFNGSAQAQVIGGIETGPNVCGGDLTCP